MHTGFLNQLVVATLRRVTVWKAREELRGLDDRLLADIGVRRDEIDRIVDTPRRLRARVPAADAFAATIGRAVTS